MKTIPIPFEDKSQASKDIHGCIITTLMIGTSQDAIWVEVINTNSTFCICLLMTIIQDFSKNS